MEASGAPGCPPFALLRDLRGGDRIGGPRPPDALPLRLGARQAGPNALAHADGFKVRNRSEDAHDPVPHIQFVIGSGIVTRLRRPRKRLTVRGTPRSRSLA